VQLNEARVRITRYFAAFRKDIRRRQVGRQNINSLMPR
jgi:hypothetical protein